DAGNVARGFPLEMSHKPIDELRNLRGDVFGQDWAPSLSAVHARGQRLREHNRGVRRINREPPDLVTNKRINHGKVSNAERWQTSQWGSKLPDHVRPRFHALPCFYSTKHRSLELLSVSIKLAHFELDLS